MKSNKIILYGLLALASVFSPVSCSDSLEPAPNGSMDMADILADPAKVGALLARCYRYIPQKNTFMEYTNLPNELCDDGHTSNDAAGGLPCQIIYNEQHSANNHPLIYNRGLSPTVGQDWLGIGNYWENYYAQIYQINQFLELIDQAVVTDDPTKDAEALRDRYKAEAHVLRAYFYSELVRWFGKVPVVTKTGSVSQDFSGYTRQPVKEVVDQIVEDCNFALATESLPWRITTKGEIMRVTKAVACGLISRMTLTAASPLFNEGNDYWEWAYNENLRVTKLLEDNGYELFSECTRTSIFNKKGTQAGVAAYRQLMCTNADISSNPDDKETIWQHSRNDNHVIWHINYVCSSFSGTAYAGLTPTQELVDAFETTDGQPILDLENPYLDDRHLQPNYNPDNTLYDPQNPYKNRDPRFEAMIVYNGKKVLWDGANNTIQTYVGGKHQIDFNMGNRRNTRTGYYLCKYIAPDIDGGSNTGNYTPVSKGEEGAVRWRLLRLGEVYLNLSEAANEAGKTADALIYLNKIRDRVLMPHVTETDQHKLRLRIRNERRIELAFEEDRYFSLRRWSKPDGDLKKEQAWLTAMYITKNPDKSYTYQRMNFRSTERGGCSNRDLLMPLQIPEANRLFSLTGKKWQNPGW